MTYHCFAYSTGHKLYTPISDTPIILSILINILFNRSISIYTNCIWIYIYYIYIYQYTVNHIHIPPISPLTQEHFPTRFRPQSVRRWPQLLWRLRCKRWGRHGRMLRLVHLEWRHDPALGDLGYIMIHIYIYLLYIYTYIHSEPKYCNDIIHRSSFEFQHIIRYRMGYNGMCI